jgi:hypothetical protein
MTTPSAIPLSAALQSGRANSEVFISGDKSFLQQVWQALDVEQLRISTHYAVTRTPGGEMYQNILMVLSVLSAFQYIISTYVPYESQIYVSDQMSLIFASIFLFDWLLALFIAPYKTKQLFEFFSILDILIVFPIFITYGRTVPRIQILNTADEVVDYILFGLGTTRILRALRLWKWTDVIQDPVNRCLGQIAIGISVMILFGKSFALVSLERSMLIIVSNWDSDASVILFLEHNTQRFTFHIWIYFTWVTLTSVGLGDIT